MEYAAGWNPTNLYIIGAWPDLKTDGYSVIQTVIFWVGSTFVIFVIVPQTAHLVAYSDDIDAIIENLSINVPIMIALLKQYMLRYHGKALMALLHCMTDDYARIVTETERHVMMEHARKSRYLSIVCSFLTYAMVSAFTALAIFVAVQTRVRGMLLVPAVFPYNTSASPIYELTWLGQIIGSYVSAVAYSCYDTFLALFGIHLCGQLVMVRRTLQSLVNGFQRNDPLESRLFAMGLAGIVLRQNRILWFAGVVEDVFNLTLLLQMIVATTMFCFTGFRMFMTIIGDDDVPVVGLIFFVLHVIYTMLHLFIYCYVGEKLQAESTEMGYASYDSEWYNLLPQNARLISFVICRSMTPIQITAGKFCVFSIELFNNLLKTSMGYLSVLLAMKDRLVEA